MKTPSEGDDVYFLLKTMEKYGLTLNDLPPAARQRLQQRDTIIAGQQQLDLANWPAGPQSKQ